MKTVAEIETNMANAIGTEGYIKHMFGLLFTDGVNQLREDADAFWLVDAIASYQSEQKNVEFQVWELKVKDNKGVLTMKEDTDCPELVRQEFDYTDFPLSEVKFYVQNNVLLLPSEY